MVALIAHSSSLSLARRYVIVRYVLHHLRLFLPTAGLEVSELAVTSPLLHGVVVTLEGWASVLLGQLETFTAPPPEYIPQCYVEPSVQVSLFNGNHMPSLVS